MTLDKDGYPRIKYMKRLWRMNRWMWTMVNGPIPDNTVVAHRCNNKGCINTNHFYLTSAEQNSTDARRDGLYKVGGEHGRAILKDDDVVRIVELYNDGATQQNLAKLYNVSQAQISHAIRKRFPKLNNR